MKFNLPILLLFLAQFVWAISWLFTKKAIQFINPVFLYVLETMIGFLILFPLLFERFFWNFKGYLVMAYYCNNNDGFR